MFRRPAQGLAVLFAAASLLAPTAASAGTPRVERKDWGKLPDGRTAELYTLTDADGSSVSISTYGGTLVRVVEPDRDHHLGDVLLGYDTLGQYLTDDSPYFGALVGRVANRIAKGTFTVDGKAYHVPINNKPNALHGGPKGYARRLWKAEPAEGETKPAVRLTLVDPDGEQGFPGTVHVTATFVYADDALHCHYEATTTKATPISLTTHGYWNLRDGGKTPITDESMRWQADRYLPTDETQIPTGELAPVAGTPFDFRQWKSLGRELPLTPPMAGIHGYDHTLVVDGAVGHLRRALELYDPASGRTMSMLTTAPGVQVYTGNFLTGNHGHGGDLYERYHGVALEAQAFPDAVNHPSFPNSVLKPGETYKQTTEYKFGISDRLPK